MKIDFRKVTVQDIDLLLADRLVQNIGLAKVLGVEHADELLSVYVKRNWDPGRPDMSLVFRTG